MNKSKQYQKQAIPKAGTLWSAGKRARNIFSRANSGKDWNLATDQYEKNQRKPKTKKFYESVEKKDLVESKPRTSKGGTILRANAFSKNFQEMGTLLSQQIWETKWLASSREGKVIPAELKFEETWIAHNNGSLPFSWASLVCPKTLSHMFLFN